MLETYFNYNIAIGSKLWWQRFILGKYVSKELNTPDPPFKKQS